MLSSRSLIKLPANWAMALVTLALGLAIGYLAAVLGPMRTGIIVVVWNLPLLVAMLAAKGIPLLLMILPTVTVFWLPLFRVGTYNVTALFLVVAALAAAVLLRAATMRSRGLQQYLVLIPLAFAPLPFSIVGSAITIGSIQNMINGVLVFTIRFALYAVLPAAFAMCPQRWHTRSEVALAWSLLAGIGYSLLVPTADQLSVGNFGNRATGMFYNPNVMGNVAVLAMNWAWAGFFDKDKSPWARINYFCLMIVAASSLLRTGSRSALVGAAVSLIVWGYILIRTRSATVRKRTRLTMVLSILLVLGLGAAALPQTVVGTRIQEVLSLGIGTLNIAGRLEASHIGLEIFASHPLGIGVGNVPVISGPYSDNLRYLERVTTTDNQFLEVMIESGVGGLSMFIVALAVLVRKSYATGTLYGYSVVASIAAMCVAGLAAFTFYSPFISSILWTMVGLAITRGPYATATAHCQTWIQNRHSCTLSNPHVERLAFGGPTMGL